MKTKEWVCAIILVIALVETCHGRFLSETRYMSGPIKNECFDSGLLFQPGRYARSLKTFLGILEKIEKYEPNPMNVIKYLLLEFALEKHELTQGADVSTELKEIQYRNILIEVLEIDINELVEIPNLQLNTFEKCALFSMLSHYSYNETAGPDGELPRVRYNVAQQQRSINETTSPHPPTLNRFARNNQSTNTISPNPKSPNTRKPFSSLFPKSTGQLDLTKKYREFGVITIDEENDIDAVDLSKVLTGMLIALKDERTISLETALNRVYGHGRPVLDDSNRPVDLLGVLTLGEVFTRGLVKQTGEFGLSGRWQNHVCPFEYVLDTEPAGATASQLKAAYDGFYIGQDIDTRLDKQYPVSKLLRMYYSSEGIYRDEIYSVCLRNTGNVDLSKETVKEFVNQYLYLYQKKVMTVTNRGILDNYYSKYTSIISSDRPKFCVKETTEEQRADKNTPNDAIFVINENDPEIEKIIPLVASIGNGLDLSPMHSSITLQIGASDPETTPNLFNQTVSSCALMKKTNGDVASSGTAFDRDLVNSLRNTLTKFKSPNDTSSLTKGQIVFFFDYSTTENGEKVFQEHVKALKNDFPDVEFKSVGTTMEVLRSYVRKQTDVYFDDDSHESLKKNILSMIKMNPMEVKYTDCKRAVSYNQRKNGDILLKDFVEVNTERLYRIKPIYFDTSSNMELKFSLISGSFEVCVSNVGLPQNGDKNCKQIEFKDQKKTLDFNLENYCKKQKMCEPIIFSVTALKHDNNECRDKKCRTAQSSGFMLSLHNFECNAAVHMILSPLLLIISIISVKYLL